jgi:hypothetical protein
VRKKRKKRMDIFFIKNFLGNRNTRKLYKKIFIVQKKKNRDAFLRLSLFLLKDFKERRKVRKTKFLSFLRKQESIKIDKILFKK